jgi:hypothetical protein
MKSSAEYAPLAAEDAGAEQEQLVDHESQRVVKTSKISWILILVVATETILVVAMFLTRNPPVVPPLLYCEFDGMFPVLHATLTSNDMEAPAQKAIEYETKVFRSVFETELSQYQGEPSLELDERWKTLYKCKRSNVFMTNRTILTSLPRRN